ncbi:MAG: hypothetical protein NTZ27_05260 [Ignavibacteriales bacterium]|nr:hypothetical protein [Ignavibacteriales bacterium]
MDNLYKPTRLIITSTAKVNSRTDLIISRVKKINPTVQIIYSNNQIPKLPKGLTPVKQKEYLDETLLLCTRSIGAPFMEVFASPGNIAENIGIMGKLAFHCPLGCEFCYLQVAGRGTPWNRVYVDLERFREEVKKEKFVHEMCLTLWSAISFYNKEALMKVPEGFKDVCDNRIRKAVLSERNNINTHKKALEYLKLNIEAYFKELGLDINDPAYKKILNNLPQYYSKNKKNPLWINISEYTDVLGLDHITGIMDELLSWLKEDKNLRIKLRTKCPNLTNILKHSNLDRLNINIDLNTNFAIKNFENRCFSQNDRIKATNKLIAAGVNVQLAIEPIIMYKNYENDYKKLILKIEKEIDLSKVADIKVGCVRYKTQLINHIKKVNLNITLFNNQQQLVPPMKGDKRWRYSEDERIKIYSAMINALKPKNKKLIKLAAETPDMWEKLGLDNIAVHSNTVYQSKRKRKK